VLKGDKSKWFRGGLVALGVALTIVLVAAMIKGFLAQGGKPRKPALQHIAILRPPPPPPPPKQEEKRPEIKKEEVKLPPPPQQEAPKEAEGKEAGKELGLDAEGGAGGDAFGLVGRKGGRDLIGGDGGARSQFAFYTHMLQQHIQEELSRNKKLGGDYRVVVRIWLAADGRIQKVDLASSTGNADIDSRLRTALTDITLKQPPPQSMPQPLRLRISSRGAG
jgi:protein TonB